MKKYILLLAIFIYTAAYSQDEVRTKSEYRIQKGISRLAAHLELNADQIAKLTSLANAYVDSLTLYSQLSLDRAAKKLRKIALEAKRQTILKQILSEDQYNGYMLYKDAMIQRVEEHRKYRMTTLRGKPTY